MNVCLIARKNCRNPNLNEHCLNALARIIINTEYATEASFICGKKGNETINTTNPVGLENEDRAEIENTKERMHYL